MICGQGLKEKREKMPKILRHGAIEAQKQYTFSQSQKQRAIRNFLGATTEPWGALWTYLL